MCSSTLVFAPFYPERVRRCDTRAAPSQKFAPKPQFSIQSTHGKQTYSAQDGEHSLFKQQNLPGGVASFSAWNRGKDASRVVTTPYIRLEFLKLRVVCGIKELQPAEMGRSTSNTVTVQLLDDTEYKYKIDVSKLIIYFALSMISYILIASCGCALAKLNVLS